MATKKTSAAKASEPTKTEGLFDKKAKSLFAEYPNRQVIYFTTDNLAFFNECDARNHAASISDGKVITINKQ